ncbi:NUDIX domain-containing protein [Brevundimonas sp. Root1423]|uniref:NUDIX domain-containing protein n=2 Tax=unclassified Brevundimonas TaxID=2622653 RepID=UPI000A52C086|nr:NUDIX domain-containing protein [Brevundimonas sp. Root1423]
MTSYRYSHPRPSVATDVVVLRNGHNGLEVLLIDRKEEPKGLALPGGFLRVGPPEVEHAVARGSAIPEDVDPSLEACALRELEEETGVHPLRIHQLGAYGDAARDPRGRYISAAYWTFVHDSRCEPRAGSDAGAVHWAALSEIGRLEFDHNRILDDAKARIRQRHDELDLFLELMPEVFTYPDFHAAYQRAIGRVVDRSNLYKRAAGLLAPGELSEPPAATPRGRGHPPKHYNLRRVLAALGETA